jgi:hypothetical protein
MQIVSAHDEYVEKSNKYDLSIAELQKELLVEQGRASDIELDIGATQGNVHSASDIGSIVAQLQSDLARKLNEYTEIQLADIKSMDISVQEDLRQLATYFPDASMVRPWYQWNKDVTAVWTCMTNYDFYGNSLDVLWICEDQSRGALNKLLAFATASYDYPSNTFSDLMVYVTKHGVNRMAVSEVK